MTATTTRVIIELCGACNGFGVVTQEERISSHEWKAVKQLCGICNGSGRLKVVTVTTVEPYQAGTLRVLQGNKKRKDRRF